METEVKLSFKDKESLNNVTLTDSFRKYCLDLNSSPMLLENSYLDTPDRTILSRGGSARVRHVSGDNTDYFEQTVKYKGGASSGLHQRYEWNVRTDSSSFSIDEFKKNAEKDGDPVEFLDVIFEGLKNTDIHILCFNSFYRTTYKLKYGNSIIEACVDCGIIRSSVSDKTDEICELELELIEGDVNDLTSLTELIVKENECVPLDKSKFMRTLALAMGNR